MARKPFPRPPQGTSYSIGFDVASQRPHLMQIIGECIAGWPFVEHNLALVLAHLLGSNTDAAMAMFASLKAFRAQQDAISAAASATLDQQHQDLITATLDGIRTAQKARDDLAHGCFGVVDTMPDALLWIEGKYHAPWNAQAILKPPTADPHAGLWTHMFIYTKDDLLEAKQTIREAWRFLHDLNAYLMNRATGVPVSAKSFAQLSSEPLVREALVRLEKRKNSPSAQ